MSADRARTGPDRSRLLPLSLGALGVVYGDIGTSPLYAVRECFFGPHRVPVSRESILGVLSLIFWSLVITVTLKYLVYVLRADNRGEGGILALMALVRGKLGSRLGRRAGIGLGLFGAALLYGDGIITPAISVLGAIEGLDVATPVFRSFVVPITVAILLGLFCVQRRGTAGVGAVFGPVMLVWFTTIAALGISGIASEPEVLAAVNPLHALHFFAANGAAGFLVLGAVFLVATGGEALYADLGHFGMRPVQIDWFGIVCPALLANYFGQGALLLSDPEAAHNPFYRLAPEWALYPLVLLATTAAVIASQAIISGAFSLTMQAVQLGYLPRIGIIHTSATEIGQIYVPAVNWALMAATMILVVGFRTSSNIANAYGVAVTTTMVITTALAYVVARRVWGWAVWKCLAVTGIFLAVDLAFFSSNIVKVAAGGWVPLAIAAAIFVLMWTWQQGRTLLATTLEGRTIPIEMLVKDVQGPHVQRVPGTAVFLTGDPKGTPIALLHNIKHNRVVHERNIFLTIHGEEVPWVPATERLTVRDLGSGFYRVLARYGFMEHPNVPAILKAARSLGLEVNPDAATYVLSRNLLVPGRKGIMATWRQRLFVFMARNAQVPTDFFRLPPGRVVELGMQVEI